MTRLLGLMLAFLAACASLAGPAVRPRSEAPLSPGPLLPVSSLPFDFQWRQRVTARWPRGRQSFDAVLMKRDGRLTLLGLSPLGVPGFVLSLGPDLLPQVDNRTGAALPFSPGYVLADIQRVFYPWLAPAPRGFHGERAGVVHGLHIRERYVSGRLVERAFLRDDAPTRGQVVIRYGGVQAGQDAPTQVDLDNPWFRYGLQIHTLEQTRL